MVQKQLAGKIRHGYGFSNAMSDWSRVKDRYCLKQWYPSDGGTQLVFEVLGIKAKASDLMQKRRYSQTPVLLQMAHLHIQCPLVLLHHGLQNAMTDS